MKKFESILLFSGGVDSFIAYHYLHQPQTLYFNVQSRYSKKELSVVQSLIPSSIIDNSLNFSDKEFGENAYIPFRNLLLAAQAVKYADTIYIAGIKDDMVSDKNEQVFLKMSILLSELEGHAIQILSPFWNMTKNNIISWFLKNIGTEIELLKTISCYSSDDTLYCGACPACFRKWCAFRSNGIDLPFYSEELLNRYYSKALNNYYIPERNETIIREIDAYRS